jgi:hypothetical protein
LWVAVESTGFAGHGLDHLGDCHTWIDWVR